MLESGLTNNLTTSTWIIPSLKFFFCPKYKKYLMKHAHAQIQQGMLVLFPVFSLQISKGVSPVHISSCKSSPFLMLLIPLVGSSQPALKLCLCQWDCSGDQGRKHTEHRSLNMANAQEVQHRIVI